MHQAGLLNHAVQKARQKDSKNPCSLKSKNFQASQQNDPILLKLNEFSGAVVIWGAGMGCAFIIFMVEMIKNVSFKKAGWCRHF